MYICRPKLVIVLYYVAKQAKSCSLLRYRREGRISFRCSLYRLPVNRLVMTAVMSLATDQIDGEAIERASSWECRCPRTAELHNKDSGLFVGTGLTNVVDNQLYVRHKSHLHDTVASCRRFIPSWYIVGVKVKLLQLSENYKAKTACSRCFLTMIRNCKSDK